MSRTIDADDKSARPHAVAFFGLFYERHHGGVPTIDPAQHRLMLHGLVERPLIFAMDDLRRLRAMPQNAPQSLSDDDVYAVSAYILNLNGLVAANATLDARSFAAVKMPNRDRLVGDARPDVRR
jgi:hypothetical protein